MLFQNVEMNHNSRSFKSQCGVLRTGIYGTFPVRLRDKSLQCVVPANGSGNLHVVLDVEVAISSVIFVVGTQ